MQHLTPNKAIDVAVHGIRKHNLDRDPMIASIIDKGDAAAPLLVERLDIPGHSYYLIPFLFEGYVGLIVQLDARDGTIQSATPVAKSKSSLFLGVEQAIDIFSQRHPGLKLQKLKLVWQPCRESSSPLQPLYQITIEGGAYYMGMNGSIYDNLTPFGRGGESHV